MLPLLPIPPFCGALQYVITGPIGIGSAIYTGATNDLSKAPVFPTTLDSQGQLSQVTYGLDTACSSLGSLASFVTVAYEWSVKIKEGRRPSPDVADTDVIELTELPPCSPPACPVYSSFAKDMAQALTLLADTKVSWAGMVAVLSA